MLERSAALALASIALAQARFPALSDKATGARMQKAAAMFERGAAAAEVLKEFLSKDELAKLNSPPGCCSPSRR
jgi:hypothetical protein